MHRSSDSFFRAKRCIYIFRTGLKCVFDEVVSALPACELAQLLEEGKLKRLLQKSASKSVISVSLGYRAAVLKEKGFGYLVPTKENQAVLGVIFDSAAFPTQNPLLEETRLTVMMEHQDISDAEICTVALKAVAEHLQILRRPDICFVKRTLNAIPQYRVGHAAWLGEIERELTFYPNLALIGSSYRGVSLSDCVANARTVCRKRNLV